MWRVSWHEAVIDGGHDQQPFARLDTKNQKNPRFEYRPVHQDFETWDEAFQLHEEMIEEGHKGKIEITRLDDSGPEDHYQAQDPYEGTWEG